MSDPTFKLCLNVATDQWPHGFSILEVDHQPPSTAIQAYLHMLRSIHRFVQLLCGVKMVMLVQPEVST